MKAPHLLKVESGHWRKYLNPFSWSIRNNSDRDFRNDEICIFRADPIYSLPPDNCENQLIVKRIIGILKDKDFPAGIMPGYCILTLELIEIVDVRGK